MTVLVPDKFGLTVQVDFGRSPVSVNQMKRDSWPCARRLCKIEQCERVAALRKRKDNSK
jgi:hypothetical protein